MAAEERRRLRNGAAAKYGLVCKQLSPSLPHRAQSIEAQGRVSIAPVRCALRSQCDGSHTSGCRVMRRLMPLTTNLSR